MHCVSKFFFTLFLLAAPGSSHASASKFDPRTLTFFSETEAERYLTCLQISAQDSLHAHELARTWIEQGGGLPARHCAALAMIRHGRPEYAAPALEALAKESAILRTDLTPDLYAQAAQAWRLAGELERALARQTEALKYRPDDLDFLLDRATIKIDLQRPEAAIEDLDRVLERAPDQSEALLCRASAYRQLEKLERAEADVTRVLSLHPESSEALAERGWLKAMKGDKLGARADWLRVLALNPESLAGDQARAGLERIDVRIP